MGDTDKSAAFVRKLLRKRDRAEALSWLDGVKPPTHRNLSEMSATESRTLVEQLYVMGAKEVFVVDIGRNGIYESTEKLLIRLPSDITERGKIFSWVDNQFTSLGFDGVEDLGQEYLFAAVG